MIEAMEQLAMPHLQLPGMIAGRGVSPLVCALDHPGRLSQLRAGILRPMIYWEGMNRSMR